MPHEHKRRRIGADIRGPEHVRDAADGKGWWMSDAGGILREDLREGAPP
jgi:hypothetical protein